MDAFKTHKVFNVFTIDDVSIKLDKEIEVEVVGAEITFPNYRERRKYEAAFQISSLSRGFFIRHCSGTLQGKIELRFYGH